MNLKCSLGFHKYLEVGRKNKEITAYDSPIPNSVYAHIVRFTEVKFVCARCRKEKTEHE